MRRAVISIGTNTTRLLVIDEGARPILHEARGTRIGKGLHGSGPIDAAAAQRTLDAIEELAGIARTQNASIAGIATSALRRADDAAAFMAEFEKRAGAPLRILSGEEEARGSFLGATIGLGIAGEVGVLDVGGGSSEYAFGSGSDVRSWLSCEIGAVRLTELVPEFSGERGPVPKTALEAARSHVAQALAPLETQPKPQRLVVVGGTGFAAGALIAQSDDRDGLSGQRLTDAQLGALFEHLAGEDLVARRKRPHMQVQRADILPAGILVVRSAMSILGRSEVTLSASDLLLGYLISVHAP